MTSRFAIKTTQQNLTYIETSLNLTISIILLVIFVGLKSDSIEKSEIYRKSSISIVLNGPKMIDSCLCVIFDLKHIKCFMVRFEFGNYFGYKHSVRVRRCYNYWYFDFVLDSVIMSLNNWIRNWNYQLSSYQLIILAYDSLRFVSPIWWDKRHL